MENNNEYYIVTPKPANQIDFVKLSPTAQAPVRGSEQAAGWDLYADISGDYISLYPGEVRKISTGIAIALPKGTFGAVFARSGLATKKGLAPANKVGVIDSDYRGEIMVSLYNHSSSAQTIADGERVAQLVITPFLKVEYTEADELSDTVRGSGGFGSTGKN